jgi:hypothetical protein
VLSLSERSSNGKFVLANDDKAASISNSCLGSSISTRAYMIVRCIKARGTSPALVYDALYEVVASNLPSMLFLLPNGAWYDTKRFEVLTR